MYGSMYIEHKISSQFHEKVWKAEEDTVLVFVAWLADPNGFPILMINDQCNDNVIDIQFWK